MPETQAERQQRQQMQPGSILITGASGYLGRRLILHYLERSKRPLVVWLHSSTPDELESKIRRLRTEFGRYQDRLSIHFGDLADDNPLATIDPNSVHSIVHSAAITRFSVEPELARQINIVGAHKLFEFARRCRRLEALGFLSSLYAAGLVEGNLAEQPLSPHRAFANHYERSKNLSEALLVEHFQDLPWRIFRLATVIADDESGTVNQYNAFHNTLKLYFYGLLSLLPGNAETRLSFITAAFAADAIFCLMQHAELQTVSHVCHPPETQLTLQRLIDLAFARFNAEADFQRRRILPPVFCDADTFELLADGVTSFGGPVVRQGLSSIAPFARQLFSSKTFLNDRLAAAYAGYCRPNPDALVVNTCDYLVRTRWGRRRIVC